MHQFRDKSRAAARARVRRAARSTRCCRPPTSSPTARDEVPVGEDQREHLELMRDVARALQRPLRRGRPRRARAPHPGRSARGSCDLQEPERKMSTTGGTEQGTVLVLDEPDAIAAKFKRAVTDSGSEIRRAPDKPGVSNLIEILAAVRGVDPEAGRGEFADARYGDLKAATADAVVEYLAPVRERYEAAARRRGGARAHPRRRRREGPRDRRAETLADVRAAHGRRTGRTGSRSSPGDRLASGHDAASPISSSTWRCSPGPFDLLLTLVLREEVDLLEVELADVVARLPRPSSRRAASSTWRPRPSSSC